MTKYIRITEEELEQFRHHFAMVQSIYEELNNEVTLLYFALKRIENRNKIHKI